MVRRRFVLMTPGHFDRMATKTYDSSFRLSSLECTADYIVHAANAYPKLVEMLKTISTGGYVIASVALYLNRRLWPFTALNSWTGGLSVGLNSWKNCT
jgi:hypothetical protein